MQFRSFFELNVVQMLHNIRGIIHMNRMISNQLKSTSRDDPQNAVCRYLNVSDFYKKYCEACLKKCDFPLQQVFFCMIKKLTKNRRRNGQS